MGAYRAALRLLPASFRAEYGGEMTAIFAERRRDASGPLEALLVWTSAFVDVVTTAARAHADLLGQDLSHPLVRLWQPSGSAATPTSSCRPPTTATSSG